MANVDIQLGANQPFKDLADAWLDQKKNVLKGRSLKSIEYVAHFMELDLNAEIQSNALILAEERGVVHMILKD